MQFLCESSQKSSILSQKWCTATNPRYYFLSASYMQMFGTWYVQHGNEHPSHPSPAQFYPLSIVGRSSPFYCCITTHPQQQQNHVAHKNNFHFNVLTIAILWEVSFPTRPAAKSSSLSHLPLSAITPARLVRHLQILTTNKQQNPRQLSPQYNYWEVSLKCLLGRFIQHWCTTSHHTKHWNH